MAPMIADVKSKKGNFNFLDKKSSDEKKKLLKLRKFVESNFEFVGDKFCKTVREVYYDKKNKKNIYGTTTSEEREELSEEGIDLFSIPWIKKDN